VRYGKIRANKKGGKEKRSLKKGQELTKKTYKSHASHQGADQKGCEAGEEGRSLNAKGGCKRDTIGGTGMTLRIRFEFFVDELEGTNKEGRMHDPAEENKSNG